MGFVVFLHLFQCELDHYFLSLTFSDSDLPLYCGLRVELGYGLRNLRGPFKTGLLDISILTACRLSRPIMKIDGLD